MDAIASQDMVNMLPGVGENLLAMSSIPEHTNLRLEEFLGPAQLSEAVRESARRAQSTVAITEGFTQTRFGQVRRLSDFAATVSKLASSTVFTTALQEKSTHFSLIEGSRNGASMLKRRRRCRRDPGSGACPRSHR